MSLHAVKLWVPIEASSHADGHHNPHRSDAQDEWLLATVNGLQAMSYLHHDVEQSEAAVSTEVGVQLHSASVLTLDCDGDGCPIVAQYALREEELQRALTPAVATTPAPATPRAARRSSAATRTGGVDLVHTVRRRLSSIVDGADLLSTNPDELVFVGSHHRIVAQAGAVWASWRTSRRAVPPREQGATAPFPMPSANLPALSVACFPHGSTAASLGVACVSAYASSSTLLSLDELARLAEDLNLMLQPAVSELPAQQAGSVMSDAPSGREHGSSMDGGGTQPGSPRGPASAYSDSLGRGRRRSSIDEGAGGSVESRSARVMLSPSIHHAPGRSGRHHRWSLHADRDSGLQPVVGVELIGVAAGWEGGCVAGRGSMAWDASVDGVAVRLWSFKYDGSVATHEVAHLGPGVQRARSPVSVPGAERKGDSPPEPPVERGGREGWHFACSGRLCDVPASLVAPVVVAIGGPSQLQVSPTSPIPSADAAPTRSNDASHVPYHVDGVPPRVVCSLSMHPWSVDWSACGRAVQALRDAAPAKYPSRQGGNESTHAATSDGSAPAAGARASDGGGGAGSDLGDGDVDAPSGGESTPAVAHGVAELMHALHCNHRKRTSVYASHLTHPSLATAVWVAMDVAPCHITLADGVAVTTPAVYLKTAPVLVGAHGATRFEWTVRGLQLSCDSRNRHPLLALDVHGDVVVRVRSASFARQATAASRSQPEISVAAMAAAAVAASGSGPGSGHGRRPGSVALSSPSPHGVAPCVLPVLVDVEAQIVLDTLAAHVTSTAVRTGWWGASRLALVLTRTCTCVCVCASGSKSTRRPVVAARCFTVATHSCRPCE